MEPSAEDRELLKECWRLRKAKKPLTAEHKRVHAEYLKDRQRFSTRVSLPFKTVEDVKARATKEGIDVQRRLAAVVRHWVDGGYVDRTTYERAMRSARETLTRQERRMDDLASDVEDERRRRREAQAAREAAEEAHAREALDFLRLLDIIGAPTDVGFEAPLLSNGRREMDTDAPSSSPEGE